MVGSLYVSILVLPDLPFFHRHFKALIEMNVTATVQLKLLTRPGGQRSEVDKPLCAARQTRLSHARDLLLEAGVTSNFES